MTFLFGKLVLVVVTLTVNNNKTELVKRVAILICFALITSISMNAQNRVMWMSWEEALEKFEEEPKKIFVASTRLGPAPSKQESERASEPGPCVFFCFLADRGIAVGSKLCFRSFLSIELSYGEIRTIILQYFNYHNTHHFLYSV